MARLAVALTDQLLAADPTNPTILYWRVYALLECGDTKEALHQARVAVEKVPDKTQAQLALAQAAWANSMFALAQRAYERALRLSGEATQIRMEYAGFLAMCRLPKLAESVATRLLEQFPESSDAWTALGIAQLRLRRAAEAQSSLQRALELEPNHARAQMAMASLLENVGRKDQAAALVKLMADSPETAEFRRLYYEEQQQEEAFRRLAEGLPAKEPAVEPRTPTRGRRLTTWLLVVVLFAIAAALALWLVL